MHSPPSYLIEQGEAPYGAKAEIVIRRRGWADEMLVLYNKVVSPLPPLTCAPRQSLSFHTERGLFPAERVSCARLVRVSHHPPPPLNWVWLELLSQYSTTYYSAVARSRKMYTYPHTLHYR